jgi:hypothetical protein
MLYAAPAASSVTISGPGNGFGSISALTSAADTLEGVAGRGAGRAQPLTAKSDSSRAGRRAHGNILDRIVHILSELVDGAIVGEPFQRRTLQLVVALLETISFAPRFPNLDREPIGAGIGSLPQEP